MADFKLKRKFDSFVPLATLKQHKDTELAGENLLHCGACVSDVLVFTGSITGNCLHCDAKGSQSRACCRTGLALLRISRLSVREFELRYRSDRSDEMLPAALHF